MYARRSTRATRPATSVVTKSGRRAGGSSGGRGHGNKRNQDRIRAAQEKGPVRRWVKVQRPPAPHIRFRVERWVLETDLTDNERQAMVVEAAAEQAEPDNLSEAIEQQHQKNLTQEEASNESSPEQFTSEQN